MESLLKIQNQYNSLDSLKAFIKTQTDYECSIEYDIWEGTIDANGQMAQCLVIKKSGMHAVKALFVNDSTLKVSHFIPNKVLNAYFGKSVKAYRSILEIAGEAIKNSLLKDSQQKAFDELEKLIAKVA